MLGVRSCIHTDSQAPFNISEFSEWFTFLCEFLWGKVLQNKDGCPLTTVGHDGGEENEADGEAKMDARLKIARMREGGFSFIAAIHLYNFIGQCLKEEIQVLTMYVSWKFLI